MHIRRGLRSSLIVGVALGISAVAFSWGGSESAEQAAEDRSYERAGARGCGWVVRQESHVTLEGTVTGIDVADGLYGDGDWSLFIWPAAGYEYLLFNRFYVRNHNGLIEVKLRPADGLLSQAYSSRDRILQYFSPLIGKRVTVVGGWADDNCGANRTEIHSLASILEAEPAMAPGDVAGTSSEGRVTQFVGLPPAVEETLEDRGGGGPLLECIAPCCVAEWTIRDGPYVMLVGTVTANDFSSFDKDWSLFVFPNPEFQPLLINRLGIRNATGLIEVEVQPPDQVLGQAYNNRDRMLQFFNPLIGKQVTVWGGWADDDCHEHKTEIHSLAAVFQTDPPRADGSYWAQYILFSNSSSFDLISRPNPPPFNRLDNSLGFSAPIPGHYSTPQWTIASGTEVDAALNKHYSTVILPGGIWELWADIESGTADQGKGFYFAKYVLGPCTPDDCAGRCGSVPDGCGGYMSCTCTCDWCGPSDCGPGGCLGKTYCAGQKPPCGNCFCSG